MARQCARAGKTSSNVPLFSRGGSVLELQESLGTKASPSNSGGTLEEVERNYIKRVLDDVDWVIEGASGAAAILDMKPSTLRNRMRKLGIEKN